MKKQIRHTPDQVVKKLAEAGEMLREGDDLADVCRRLEISGQTYYRWRKQFGGLKLDDARRLTELAKENASLRRLLATMQLERDALSQLSKELTIGAVADL